TKLGRQTAKGVAGLDLAALFVGSDGTLGVIVEITLALKPKLAPPVTAVGIFPGMESAGRTGSAYMASGAARSMLARTAGATVAMSNAFGDFGLPDGARALPLAQPAAAGAPAVAALESFQPIAEVRRATEVFFSHD